MHRSAHFDTGIMLLTVTAALAGAQAASAGQPVRANVQSVEGKVIEINAGVRQGVQVGQRFRILTPGRVIWIPLTKTSTYSEGKPIALVFVLNVDELSARCEVESGEGIVPGLDAVSITGLEVTSQEMPMPGGTGYGERQPGPGTGPLTLPAWVAIAADPPRPAPGQAVTLTVKGLADAKSGLRIKWSVDKGALLAAETAVDRVTWIAAREKGQYEIRATVTLPDDTRREGRGIIGVIGEPVLPAEIHEEKAIGNTAFGGRPLRVEDIAFDAEGSMYVLDASQKCVFKIERGGRVLEVAARGTCAQAGVRAPRAIAVHRGNIYILDSVAPWVKVIEASDRLLAALGAEVDMKDPVDLEVDSRGLVYVLDSKLCCFHVFDAKGGYLHPRGTRGKNPGEFLRPVAIDISPMGHIYVLDQSRKDVQVFNREYALTNRFGIATRGRGQALDLAVAPDGDSFYVIEHGRTSAVGRYDANGRLLAHSYGDVAKFPGMPARARRIAVDPLGEVYVLPQSRVGIHRYTAVGLADGLFAAEPPSRPTRLAVDDAGSFAILDAREPYVRLYDADGWLLSRFGERQESPTAYRLPHGLAMTRTGRAVATVSQMRRGAFDPVVEMPTLHVFRSNGSRLRAVGPRGKGPGQFILATDVDTDRQGNVYVIDQVLGRISLYAAEGAGSTPESERTLPRGSYSPQEMIAPGLLGVDAETGDYYVYDVKTRQIKKFTRDSIFVGMVDADLGYRGIDRMRVDHLGLLWAYDRKQAEIRRIDFRGPAATASLALSVASLRGGARDFGVDATGRVYVLAGDGLIHVFK